MTTSVEGSWQPWLRRSMTSYKRTSPRTEARKHPPTDFVLFARLPANGPTAVCIFRNLPSSFDVFLLQKLLEMQAGLPANIIRIESIKGQALDMNIFYKFGENIANGETIRIVPVDKNEGIIWSVWSRSLLDVQRQLSSSKNKKSTNETTKGCALFVAAKLGSVDICKELVRHGASVNFATDYGNTPTHVAASVGHINVLQLLVAQGVNIRSLNIDGKTPLDIAVDSGHFECARWIWLNQWSISISKDSFAPKSSVNNHLLSQKLSEENDRRSDGSTNPKGSHKPKTAPASPRLGEKERERPFQRPKHLHQNVLSTNSSKMLSHLTSSLRRQRSIPSKHSSDQLNVNPSKSFSNLSSSRINEEQHWSPTSDRKIEELLRERQMERGYRASRFVTSRPNTAKSILKKEEKKPKISPRPYTAKPMETPKVIPRDLEPLQHKAKSAPHLDDLIRSSYPPTTVKGNMHQNSNDGRPKTRQRRQGTVAFVNLKEDEQLAERKDFATEHDTGKTDEDTGEKVKESPLIKETPSTPTPSSSPHSSLVQINSHTPLEEPSLPIHHTFTPGSNIDDTVTVVEEQIDMTSPEKFEQNVEQHSQPGTTSLSPTNHSNPSTPSAIQGSNFSEKESVTMEALFSREIITIPTQSNFNTHEVENAETISKSKQERPSILSPPKPKTPPTVSEHKVESAVVKTSSIIPSCSQEETPKNKPKDPPLSSNTSKTSTPRSPTNETHTGTGLNWKIDNNIKKSEKVEAKKMSNEEEDKKQKEYEEERKRKSSEAFQAWLLQKRRSSSLTNAVEEHHQPKKKMSYSLTHEEWLKHKLELKGIFQPATPEEDKEGFRKRSVIKRGKTFEEWAHEKERRKTEAIMKKKQELEAAETKAKSEEEKRKKEFEEKMRIWMERKRFTEIDERQRRRSSLMEEAKAAHEMFIQWKSKPRVKSFEEWMEEKNVDKKIAKVTQAQNIHAPDVVHSIEERRNELAKEKFKIWLIKKDMSALHQSRAELKKAKKERKLLEQKLASLEMISEENKSLDEVEELEDIEDNDALD